MFNWPIVSAAIGKIDNLRLINLVFNEKNFRHYNKSVLHCPYMYGKLVPIDSFRRISKLCDKFGET